MAGNIFKKALANAADTTPKSSKDKKARIKITNASHPEFYPILKRSAIIREEMAKLKAELELNDDQIKELGVHYWSERYEASGVNPDSVMIEIRERDNDQAADTAQFMLNMKDQYIKIDEAAANQLKADFGEEVVTETNTYEFNPEMVEKHGELIAELIDKCDKIPDADKDIIITAKTKREIAKGTIDKFAILAKKKNMKVEQVVGQFKPIVATRNVEYIPATALH
jgi:hypothetical protein